MRTEPIKCLSSVSKANMDGIKNFPSAVITPITLPIADSTVICLVQSCFVLLPGPIGFVYADCSFAEFLSLFFSHVFSFPWARLRALNSPPPPVLIFSRARVSPRGHELLGRKRCCCCSQLLCECKDDPPFPFLPLSLKNKESSQEVKQLVKERAVGICWGQWLWSSSPLFQGEKERPCVSPNGKGTQGHMHSK